VEARLRAWKPPEGERFHAWVAIILWCVVSTMLVALGAGPIARGLVVLPCVLIAPGLVVVLLLRLPGLALTSTVVLLVGLALGVLVPAVFLYTGTWSPLGAFAVIAAGTVLGASAGISFDAQRSRHGKSARVPTSRRGDPGESDLVVRHQGGGTAEHVVAPVRVAAPTPAAAKLLARIDDAIAAARGPTGEVHLDTANLDAPIADDEQVVVPARGAAGAAAAATPPAAGYSPTAPLDLNTATLEQLEGLPGVGPVTAQKILDFRQAHGPFHSVTELEGVPGIGPAHVAQLKGLVIP
jgi:competence protein ComEA